MSRAEIRVPPPRPACRIEAARAEAIEVSAEISVSVTDGALSLSPTDDPRRLAVRVEHPIRFEGTASIDDQRLTSSEPLELAAGALRAPTGVEILSIARGDRGLIAHLALGRAAGERGITLVAGPIAMPCAIDANADGEAREIRPRPPAGAELRIARRSPLEIRPVRIAPRTIEVRARRDDGVVPVWIVDRQADAARIVIEHADGSRVEGWSPLEALRAPTAAEAEAIDRLVLDPSEPAVIPAVVPALGEPAPIAPNADELIGTGTLRARAEILDDANGERWAFVADTSIEARVRWARGHASVEILELPGATITPGRAWIRRADVSMPD